MLKTKLFLIIFLALSLSAYAQRTNTAALADQYFNEQAYEKAADLYEKLFNDSRQSYFFKQYLSCLINLQQYEQAERFVKKQIKKSPQLLVYKVELGLIYLKMKEEQKAEKEFKEAISKLSENPNQLSELANTFYRSGQLDHAAETYRKGRKLFNNEILYFNEMARIYKEKGDKTGLINEYLDVLQEREELLGTIQNSISTDIYGDEDFTLLKSLLLKRIQKYPANISLSELLVWQFIQRGEFEAALFQSIALDKRLNEEGQRIMALAGIFVSNQRYEPAVKAYEYIVSKGKSTYYYSEARLELLRTQKARLINANYTSADIEKLENEYLAFLVEFGKNSSTAFAMKDLAALQALYMSKLNEGMALLEELIEMAGLSRSFIAQCKLDLGDIYLLMDEGWEATLMYGQVDKAFKDDILGQEAKFRNARLSYFRGEFDWAKAQLDVLKGNTTQLFSNDALNLSLLIADNTGLDSTTDALKLFSTAELFIFQNKFIEARLRFDSINLRYPNHSLTDEIWMAQARIFIKQNKPEEAISEFKKVLDDYGTDIWADDALFLSAELYQNKLNNLVKAKELYEKLLTDYPGSLYVVEARKRFRALRGDILN